MNFILWIETLICGIALGCFLMFAIVYLAIQIEEQRENRDPAFVQARQNGMSFAQAKRHVTHQR